MYRRMAEFALTQHVSLWHGCQHDVFRHRCAPPTRELPGISSYLLNISAGPIPGGVDKTREIARYRDIPQMITKDRHPRFCIRQGDFDDGLEPPGPQQRAVDPRVIVDGPHHDDTLPALGGSRHSSKPLMTCRL